MHELSATVLDRTHDIAIDLTIKYPDALGQLMAVKIEVSVKWARRGKRLIS